VQGNELLTYIKKDARLKHRMDEQPLLKQDSTAIINNNNNNNNNNTDYNVGK
jgi:hypothetical protein